MTVVAAAAVHESVETIAIAAKETGLGSTTTMAMVDVGEVLAVLPIACANSTTDLRIEEGQLKRPSSRQRQTGILSTRTTRV